MGSIMKAMILNRHSPIESSPLELSETAAPEPKRGEIRIKIEACGICHTDLHIIEGELPVSHFPLIVGHQIVGSVHKCGTGAQRFAIGDMVGVPWLNRTCGKCPYCLGGNENLCEDIRFTGYHQSGGYAQYITVGEKFAYRISRTFSAVKAAPLLCAGIIGYRSLVLSGVKKGERLALYGFGATAHIALQVARWMGAEVSVFSRGETHRRLARKLGAVWTGAPDKKPPSKVDRAIIFAPAGRLVPIALENLRRGGTLAIGAVWLDEIPQLDYQRHLFGEKKVISVTASTRRDGEDFLRIAAKIPVKITTEVFPLGEANYALQLLKAGKIDGAGVLEI